MNKNQKIKEIEYLLSLQLEYPRYSLFIFNEHFKLVTADKESISFENITERDAKIHLSEQGSTEIVYFSRFKQSPHWIDQYGPVIFKEIHPLQVEGIMGWINYQFKNIDKRLPFSKISESLTAQEKELMIEFSRTMRI
jgi:hypothetical protein